jgi:hypothetical protein
VHLSLAAQVIHQEVFKSPQTPKEFRAVPDFFIYRRLISSKTGYEQEKPIEQKNSAGRERLI